MKLTLINTDTTSDKKDFLYCVKIERDNGKTFHAWQTSEQLNEEFKNKNITLCLTYIDYDFFDTWTDEKHPQTFSGVIFESINDFEQWKKTLKRHCEFIRLDILN